jgi:hypothetical protein
MLFGHFGIFSRYVVPMKIWQPWLCLTFKNVSSYVIGFDGS